MNSLGDTSIENMDTENGDAKPGSKRWKLWRKTAGGKVNKKKKKTSLQKSLRLKKYVQPKNAIMCLNELVPGVTFDIEQEGKAPNLPTQVSVTVNGQKYHGFGSSKQMAKQAAAEAALVSFVKPPPPTGSTDASDTTPWAVLASFAMFKLFNEWREGRFGVAPSTAGTPFGSGMMNSEAMSQTFQALMRSGMPTGGTTDMETTKTGIGKEGLKDVPNPSKQLPSNAASMHPIMLLHQMKPNVQFIPSSVVTDGKKVCSMRAVIDNRTFVGEGFNLKKAKLDLALKANKALFGVDSLFTATS